MVWCAGRLCDLGQWSREEFRVSVSVQTLSREARHGLSQAVGPTSATPSLVDVCPPRDLERAAAENAELSRRIAAQLAARLVAERVRAKRLTLPHAADRLLDVLHSLPVGRDGSRSRGRTWKTLAAELGLSHEATYCALARLERAGVLRRQAANRRHAGAEQGWLT